MTTAAVLAAALAAAVNVIAAALGALRYVHAQPRSQASWRLIRAGQATAAAAAILAGAFAAAGSGASDDLYYLYALLPVAVSLIAEQLRVASAETVLDARGLPDAAAVGELEAAEQQGIVTEILQRELLVMAIAAAVIAFLEVRAATTASF